MIYGWNLFSDDIEVQNQMKWNNSSSNKFQRNFQKNTNEAFTHEKNYLIDQGIIYKAQLTFKSMDFMGSRVSPHQLHGNDN